MHRPGATVAILIAACSAPAGPDPVQVPAAFHCEPSTPDGSNPDDGISFDVERMLCIGIDMDADAFVALSGEHRLGDSAAEDIDVIATRLATDCATPFPNRFHWYPADLEIGGRIVERIGVRKKGFYGSVVDGGECKPALKIKTDAFVADQTFGLTTERITLNNNLQDRTRLRTCLAYELFAAANYPAPRCNLANVVVNAEPIGAYANVEAVKVRFLLREFFSADGSLYESTLADLTPDFLPGPEQDHLGRWEAKTDVTVRADLEALIDAMNVPDAELEASVAPVLDLDRFITYWALETLLNASDGYAANRNNFFVYFDPLDAGRAVFLPWGLDQVMTDEDALDRGAITLESFLLGELPRRLSRIPSTAARFEAELARLLDEVWDEERILASVDAFEAQVQSAQDDPGHPAAVEELRDWIRGRRGVVEAWLAAGLPAGSDDTESCLDSTAAETARLHETFAWGCSASGGSAGLLVLLAVRVLRRR